MNCFLFIFQIDLRKKLEHMFLDHYRQDDMFPRRSVLTLISTWVENRIFTIDKNKKDSACGENLNLVDFKAVLVNSIDDFDWEIRCACVGVLEAIFRASFDLPFIVDIFNSVIRKAVQDCEFKVQEMALHCLYVLQTESKDWVETGNVTVTINGHCNGAIEEKTENHFQNMEELTAYLSARKDTEFDSDGLRHLMSSCDFEQLISGLKEMDEMVKEDPVSFMEDIVASARKADENLLDCY